MAKAPLPPEIVSLVHHVELNKAGWWDKGIQRLAVAAIWLSGTPITVVGVADRLRTEFFVTVSIGKLKEQVDKLISSGTLVAFGDGRMKISESAVPQLEKLLREAEEVEEKAKARFFEVLTRCCPALVPEEEWKLFNEKLVLPLVREIGARTYQLVSGTGLSIQTTARFPAFLTAYAAEHREALRAAIVDFLDPKDPDVRSYLLRQLNAYFFLEAGNLQQGTIEALAKIAAVPPSFKIFVDTNFLFSFLALHENPSNEAAESVMRLTSQLEGKLSCRFYVSALTIDETKRVIGAHKDFLQGLRLTPNLAEAALESQLSGVAKKFVEQSVKLGRPISADDYFAPYLTNLIATLRAKNVEFFNEKMDHYGTKQEVVDDILAQLKFEREHFHDNAKTYKQLEHDVILWQFVTDKRPVRVESPIEATFWIVTVDYHFLGFDSFKRRGSTMQVPVCVHPTSLIQMLQFWLPRTSQFEEAVLGSLRWPFLFQAFDPAAERVTIRILEALARFENVGELPKEVVANILVNEALRQKLAVEGDVEKRVELVREVLTEQHEKIKSALESVTSESGRLKQEVAAKDTEIVGLRKELATQQEAATSELQRRAELEGRIRSVERALEEERKKGETRKAVQGFALLSVAGLAAALVLSLGMAVMLRSSWGFWRPFLAGCSVLLLVWAEMTDRLGRARPAVKEWRLYGKFHKYKSWLWAVAIAGIIGNTAFAIIRSLLEKLGLKP